VIADEREDHRMKAPFERCLEEALKEFEQDRRNKGLKEAGMSFPARSLFHPLMLG